MNTFTSTGVQMRCFECSGCGITYAISEAFAQKRMEDKKTWYCPNQCRLYFSGRSDLQKAKDEAQRQKERAERASQEAETAKHQRNALKGHLTRTKNRIAAGVCPCCNCTFQNLRRHMADQHPEYGPKK